MYYPIIQQSKINNTWQMPNKAFIVFAASDLDGNQYL